MERVDSPGCPIAPAFIYICIYTRHGQRIGRVGITDSFTISNKRNCRPHGSMPRILRTGYSIDDSNDECVLVRHRCRGSGGFIRIMRQ